jgi:hypothetical protein
MNTSYFFFLFLFFPFSWRFSFFFFASFLHKDNKEENKRKRMFGGKHLQTRSEENKKNLMVNKKNKRQIIRGIHCRTIPK